MDLIEIERVWECLKSKSCVIDWWKYVCTSVVLPQSKEPAQTDDERAIKLPFGQHQLGSTFFIFLRKLCIEEIHAMPRNMLCNSEAQSPGILKWTTSLHGTSSASAVMGPRRAGEQSLPVSVTSLLQHVQEQVAWWCSCCWTTCKSSWSYHEVDGFGF